MTRSLNPHTARHTQKKYLLAYYNAKRRHDPAALHPEQDLIVDDEDAMMDDD